ncbi:MAG TPA: pseudouridine synthase [Cytophagaceae bacterium]
MKTNNNKRNFDKKSTNKKKEDGSKSSSFSLKGENPKEHKSLNSKSKDSKPKAATNKSFRNSGKSSNEKEHPLNKKIKTAYGRKEGSPLFKKKQHQSFDQSKPQVKSAEDGLIRLNRYIANSGVCSRRDADKLIQEGLISVNGTVITELGYKVKPTDTVKYDNKTLNREKPVYILLNKPKDFITTLDDPENRKTVMDIVGKACKERIFPVGRLDRNTTGLLLLTNDGELAEKLTHPSHKIKKVYQVELNAPVSREDFDKIKQGLRLEDGPVKVDDIAYITPDKRVLGLEIHEGRNRIVRRIFEHLGYEVVKLDRTVYAGLTKKDLPRGQWRFLTDKEIKTLKYIL